VQWIFIASPLYLFSSTFRLFTGVSLIAWKNVWNAMAILLSCVFSPNEISECCDSGLSWSSTKTLFELIHVLIYPGFTIHDREMEPTFSKSA
jgi:hypothetical protein